MWHKGGYFHGWITGGANMSGKGAESVLQGEIASLSGDPPEQGGEDSLGACLSMADELVRLLREETALLQRFNNQGLLVLLPRKELLARTLRDRMEALQRSPRGDRPAPAAKGRGELKAILAEINELNRSNGVFVERSLEYFNDFIDSVCPSSYGPNQEGPWKHKAGNFKGLSFRKEI